MSTHIGEQGLGATSWPRISILLLVVLVVFTADAYVVWWYYDRIKRIDNAIPTSRMPRANLVFICVFTLLYVAWAANGHYWLGDSVTFAVSVKRLITAAYICNGIVSAHIAAQLNRHYHTIGLTQRLCKTKADLLQFLYLQWKFNR